MTPTLIVLSGLPGTGKSTLAATVAKALKVPVFSVDPIESAIVAAGITRSLETGLAAYLVAEGQAGAHLASGQPAIIDAVNSVAYAKRMWIKLATKHRAPLRVIECVCSDEALHRKRLAKRKRGLKIAEPSWPDIEKRKIEWVPWTHQRLVVDAVEPAATNATRVLRWLRAADRLTVRIRGQSPA